MRKDKNTAISLRKEGNSYNQISEQLGVPKSTLSYWLKDLSLSKKAREKINKRAYNKSVNALVKRNKEQTDIAKRKAETAKRKARSEVCELLDNKLFLLGTALYWAEGYKKGAYDTSKSKTVDFTNSDPEMVKLMIRFFRDIAQVDKYRIKIQIIVHHNVNKEEAINYWSKKINIPKNQFTKVCYSKNRHSKTKRNPNSLPYGTLHIRISDIKVFYRIIGWIEEIKSNHSH